MPPAFTARAQDHWRSVGGLMTATRKTVCEAIETFEGKFDFVEVQNRTNKLPHPVPYATLYRILRDLVKAGMKSISRC